MVCYVAPEVRIRYCGRRAGYICRKTRVAARGWKSEMPEMRGAGRQRAADNSEGRFPGLVPMMMAVRRGRNGGWGAPHMEGQKKYKLTHRFESYSGGEVGNGRVWWFRPRAVADFASLSESPSRRPSRGFVVSVPLSPLLHILICPPEASKTIAGHAVHRRSSTPRRAWRPRQQRAGG